MKTIRLMLLTLITATPLLTFGQNNPKFVYCDIVGTEKGLSTKVTIEVDFGQQMKTLADNRMKDGAGKPLVFNSMMDALNFLGKQGWEFVQAYTTTVANQNVCHFLMKKSFDELDAEVKTELLKD